MTKKNQKKKQYFVVFLVVTMPHVTGRQRDFASELTFVAAVDSRRYGKGGTLAEFDLALLVQHGFVDLAALVKPLCWQR